MSLGVIEMGISYNDFLQFTPYDIAYLYDKYKEKQMVDFTLMRNSFLNAYVNARRGKKEKFIPLFEEIEGKKKKEEKQKTPEELKQEREQFFRMIEELEGGH